MLTIRQIYQKDYPTGKQVFYNYTSDKYYEIHMETNHNGWRFSLTEGAGIMVIQHMKWNNTLLIHNLYVDKQFKRKGIGSALFEIAKKRARELGVRMITLETQTSNYPAIQFYLKNGFQFIGLNLNSYSNEDIKKKEVRIEMGYLIENRI